MEFSLSVCPPPPFHIGLWCDTLSKSVCLYPMPHYGHGCRISGGIIPPDILVTQSRPDLVLLNRADKTICLLELTCSFERNAEAAYLRKSIRYTSLKNDLEDIGYKCFLVPFEVGSRGHIKKSTKSNIFSIFTTMKISANINKCLKNMSKISLLASFTIFHAYTQPTWRDPPFLTTWIVTIMTNIFKLYCRLLWNIPFTVSVLYNSLSIFPAIYLNWNICVIINEINVT